MNKKKFFILILCILFAISAIGTYIFFTREDKSSSLNMIEKKWIDNNKKKLLDISIFSDVSVFSYHGSGIIFDFLDSLEKETGLEFNKVSYTLDSEVKTDYAFKVKDIVESNDILIYQDNYVLVTKNKKVYTNPSNISGINIGVLNSDLDKINMFLLGSDVTFRTFDSKKALLETFESDKSLGAIAVPKLQFLESILTNSNYTIGYNITEYKSNYVLSLGEKAEYSTLNSILNKYYKKWSKESFEEDFNKYFVSNFFNYTGEESQDNAKFHSKRYVYGFIDNKPFDTISDGELVGINNSVISDFSNFSDVVIEYKEYKNYEELVNAFNSNEIDFYLETNGNVDYKLDVFRTTSPFDEDIIILTNSKNNIIVNSANSLLNYEVGVVKGSKISDYLKKYSVKVKEFNSVDELVNSRKMDAIALDNFNYHYYFKKSIRNYDFNFRTNLNSDYSYIFRDITENKQIESLFNFYLSINPISTYLRDGLSNSVNVNIISVLIRYCLIFASCLFTFGIILLIVRKTKRKRRKNPNNLSKGDKLKYMDRLTSLKNRNYLNDNIEKWDESEVYPQTIIIVDLNDIAYINDNYGHAEGDLVIKEAANILIQNQLSNSEIIRTNGNEFLIYLVSYDEKQVISYIRKLSKEFKELAHGFGAAIGYSVINDAIKTIDDAVNEATLDMRNNKEEASKE